jgi:tetratricopeptide (TPR) repeat protein
VRTEHRHPLAALRAEMGLSAVQYLAMVDLEHRRLGYGAMAIRREKVTRWESGAVVPDSAAQQAMAQLHGVPAEAVKHLGWPSWLEAAVPEHRLQADHAVLHSPWTPAGTVVSTAAAAQGGSMDRRGFLIASGGLLTSIGTDWSGALDAVATTSTSTGRRPLTATMLDRLEQRLDDLRRLDDSLGGGELRQLATAEFGLLSRLADEAVYDEATGRRLFSALAESARICGWLHFDAGRHAAAQSYYITALRASATAGDGACGANVLAFMAIQTYSVGNPQDAVNLVRTALAQAARATPRVRAMLHMRAGRALSKTGARQACAHELDAARAVFEAGSSDDDPPWSYWMSAGEIEMIAASSALELDDPQKALEYFGAARDSEYAAAGYTRDNALFLVRSAEAHLRLGDVDAACAVAGEALDQIDGVDSARPSGALSDFTKQLRPHSSARSAHEFLVRAG